MTTSRLSTYFFTLLILALTLVSCGDVGTGGLNENPDGPIPTEVFTQYAYFTNYEGNTVVAYAVDDTTGQLHLINKELTGDGPDAVTVDPSGSFAYIANSASNDVSQFSIGPKGALTPLSPDTVAAGNGPGSVAVDPAGHFAYVVNRLDGSVSQYSIGPDGGLTPLAAGPVNAGDGAASIAMDPTSAFAYVANSNAGNVSQYSIGADGALIPLTPATVAADNGANSVTIDPTGSFAYVANTTGSSLSQFSVGNISQYSIGASGALTHRCLSPQSMLIMAQFP